MTSAATSVVLLAALIAAVFIGRFGRSRMPVRHLESDTQDAVKLALGLLSTMTALLLGLLLGSAKAGYDTQRSEVVQMAAEVAYLNRVLIAFGPGAADARLQFQGSVKDTVSRMWPLEAGARAQLDVETPFGDSVFHAIQSLSPRDEDQRSLKLQATTLAMSLGLHRVLVAAQASSSTPRLLLLAVGLWLVVIFLFFGLLAPPNATTMFALVSAAVSVAVAVFLIVELEQPLGGFIHVSSEPFRIAMSHFLK